MKDATETPYSKRLRGYARWAEANGRNAMAPDMMHTADHIDALTAERQQLLTKIAEGAILRATLAGALRGLLAMAEDLAATFPIKPTEDGMTAIDRARAALARVNGSPQAVAQQDDAREGSE